jgi:hypothetical protein
VASVLAKRSDRFTAAGIDDIERLVNVEGASVEPDVVVGAEAEDVGDRVGSIMWPTQWSNVSSFCVRASFGLDPLAADLTEGVMELLDCDRVACVPDLSLDYDLLSVDRP